MKEVAMIDRFDEGHVIGVPVTVADLDAMVMVLVDACKRKRWGYVCIANVHMVVTAKRDPSLKIVMEQALAVTSDGMPLVWALKRQGFLHADRVAGPDLMARLCGLPATASIPVYFFGGYADGLSNLREAISAQFPYLQVVGWEAPPQLAEYPELDSDVVDRIRGSGAKLVFVGLGCPKQEFWMAVYSPYLPAILVGVGAAFDLLAGAKRRAPLWMQRSGLEWLFRLLTEPGRLWRRYLVTNTLFVWYLLCGWLKGLWGKY